jgi:hypothetical protein
MVLTYVPTAVLYDDARLTGIPKHSCAITAPASIELNGITMGGLEVTEVASDVEAATLRWTNQTTDANGCITTRVLRLRTREDGKATFGLRTVCPGDTAPCEFETSGYVR